MNTPARLMALERMYDLARVDASEDRMVQLGSDYCLIMRAIIDLSIYEVEKRDKKAILLGGRG